MAWKINKWAMFAFSISDIQYPILNLKSDTFLHSKLKTKFLECFYFTDLLIFISKGNLRYRWWGYSILFYPFSSCFYLIVIKPHRCSEMTLSLTLLIIFFLLLKFSFFFVIFILSCSLQFNSQPFIFINLTSFVITENH